MQIAMSLDVKSSTFTVSLTFLFNSLSFFHLPLVLVQDVLGKKDS